MYRSRIIEIDGVYVGNLLQRGPSEGFVFMSRHPRTRGIDDRPIGSLEDALRLAHSTYRHPVLGTGADPGGARS
ncbi:hypothetical protein [Rhizosaccharibacter radicis]|uniref:Uncharacterized protein n=1 Tax=Rhizosaccharibacter radicis TaxID=2782605 RepID=A0ABT1VTW1_9PROT|nr:hypothetical protein [Acetobacteraceae bacterium KSS12]